MSIDDDHTRGLYPNAICGSNIEILFVGFRGSGFSRASGGDGVNLDYRKKCIGQTEAGHFKNAGFVNR